MEPAALLEDLKRQEEELRTVLQDLEAKFQLKKEQYLKIQGAIEGLAMCTPDDGTPTLTEDNVEP